eukprot:jgi/Bigna1/141420/aug1.62_g16128
MKSKTEIDCMSAEAVREELKKLAAGDVKVSKSPIAPTIADPPSISSLKTPAKIEALQKYINSFKYNHIGKEYFNPDKRVPLLRVMNCAKTIIKESLPIKCLEATMLAIYLTRDIANLSRVPLRFASSVHGHIYWHIVLALRGKCGRWGALGLSRRPDLGFKPLKFSTLPALVKSYKEAYEGIGHKIVKVTVGLPVGTKVESHEKVYWQFMSIPVSKAKWPDVEAVRDKYLMEILCNEEVFQDYGEICEASTRNRDL